MDFFWGKLKWSSQVGKQLELFCSSCRCFQLRLMGQGRYRAHHACVLIACLLGSIDSISTFHPQALLSFSDWFLLFCVWSRKRQLFYSPSISFSADVFWGMQNLSSWQQAYKPDIRLQRLSVADLPLPAENVFIIYKNHFRICSSDGRLSISELDTGEWW